MEPKFPSGMVTVTIRDLQKHQRSQPSCNICHKRWSWESHACISDNLCVLHPCQHLVGSGCWKTVPEEQKDKCPECNIMIEFNETVRVVRKYEEASLESNKRVKDETDTSQNQELSMKSSKNQKQALNPHDVAMILYLINLRESMDFSKETISIFVPSKTEAVPELHLGCLIFYLTHTGPYNEQSAGQKLVTGLRNFNMRNGTSFSLVDLRKAVSSPEDLNEILRIAEGIKRSVKKMPRVLPQVME